MSNTTFDTQSFFKKLGLPGIIALASCLLLILSAFPPLAHLYVGFDSGIHMSDFDFPEFKQFFMALVEVAPCGLFVAYLLFFREKSNLAIMFPIIFFAIAFSASVDFFNTVHYISEGYYSAAFNDVLKILALCGLVAFGVISGIFLLKGRINKTFILLILIFGAVCAFMRFISVCKSLEYYFSRDLVSLGINTMGIAGTAGFYVALFMFTSTHNAPAIISASAPVINTGYTPINPNANTGYNPATPNVNPGYVPPVTTNMNQGYTSPVTPNINPGYAPVTPNVNPQPTAMSTQERLAFLKEQLDRGIISKEVYDAQVAEAIAQL